MQDIYFARRKAVKQFEKLDGVIKKRIVKELEVIRSDPKSGIPLTGDLLGYYKWRIGSYRIIYSFNDETINILSIDHREGVYEEIKRYIKVLDTQLSATNITET